MWKRIARLSQPLIQLGHSMEHIGALSARSSLCSFGMQSGQVADARRSVSRRAYDDVQTDVPEIDWPVVPNQVQIICTVGRQPEYNQNARVPLVKFGVVIKKKGTGGPVANDLGVMEEKAEWIQVTAFEPLAKLVHENISKGSLVQVTGRLQVDEWLDKATGAKRSAPSITLTKIAKIKPYAGGGGGYGGGGQRMMQGDRMASPAPMQPRRDAPPPPTAAPYSPNPRARAAPLPPPPPPPQPQQADQSGYTAIDYSHLPNQNSPQAYPRPPSPQHSQPLHASAPQQMRSAPAPAYEPKEAPSTRQAPPASPPPPPPPQPSRVASDLPAPKKWMMLLREFENFHDMRAVKKDPMAPDFVHSQDPSFTLRMGDEGTPTWVPQSILELDNRKQSEAPF